MAQYWEDWSGYTVGDDPTVDGDAGWTTRWHSGLTLAIVSDAGAPSGKALDVTQSSNNRSAISFDAVDSDADRDDIEVRMLVRAQAVTQFENAGGPVVRGSGTDTSETGYGLPQTGGGNTNCDASSFYYASAVSNWMDQGGMPDILEAGEDYWLVISAQGTTIDFSVRAKATPDTVIDSLNYTSHTGVQGVGWAGLYVFSPYTVRVLAFGVGTNGDSAPTSDPGADTTAPVITAPSTTNVTSNSARVLFTTDEGNGTGRTVITTSATQPSVVQIKAQQDHTGASAPAGSVSVQATGAQQIDVSGLTAATAYYAHILHTDQAGNDSNRITTAQFTTSAAGTQYEEDWDGHTIGATAVPTGWTERWDTGNASYEIVADSDAVNGKALRFTAGTNVRCLLSFDAIDSDANRDVIEQAILVRFSYPSAQNGPSLVCRASGGSTSETGCIGQTVDSGGHKLRFYRYASASTVGEVLDNATVSDGLYWLRFRMNANDQWQLDYIDPETLTVVESHSGTDANLQQVGWAGIFTFTSGMTYDVLHYLAATNGDSVTLFTVGAEQPGVEVVVYDGSTPVASQTSIRFLWWDTPYPSGAPDYEVTTETTDANGEIVVDLSGNTALSIGETGFFLMYKVDATDHRDSLVCATQWTVQDLAA